MKSGNVPVSPVSTLIVTAKMCLGLGAAFANALQQVLRQPV